MVYSLNFRRHVLKVKESKGLTFTQTAERFCIGVASLTRWVRRLAPQAKRNKPATKLDMYALEKDIAPHPHAYQRERAARLGVSPGCIQSALRRLDITRKKRRSNIRRQIRGRAPNYNVR
jgi:transposase